MSCDCGYFKNNFDDRGLQVASYAFHGQGGLMYLNNMARLRTLLLFGNVCHRYDFWTHFPHLLSSSNHVVEYITRGRREGKGSKIN